jgi:dTDP-4-dehydrorhamnose 3,5-epimerase
VNSNQIFITGANGQLGTALRAKYPEAKFADIAELDITDPKSVKNYNWSNIKTIINAAAYTNVDGAETDEGRVAAWKVNATAIGNLAQVCRQNDITLVHISTDYVFDGTQDNHNEDEDFSPLSVYGASKAAGDLLVQTLPNHYILRTSWVIGEGKNFVRTMLGVAEKGIEPSVVNDQIGRLTFTGELVRAIDHLLTNTLGFGTYNVSNDGQAVSWAGVTREIYKVAGLGNKVTDISTEAYYEGKEDIAPRPKYSSLNLSKIKQTGFRPNDWKEDLVKYIEKEQQ